jgi:hypothetical protein
MCVSDTNQNLDFHMCVSDTSQNLDFHSSGLWQKHTCGNPGSGSVKPVDGIPTLSIHVMFCYLIGKSYGV